MVWLGAIRPHRRDAVWSDSLCQTFFVLAHSGVKKAHDWAIEQLVDLFHTTTKVKNTQVDHNRGQRSGNIELVAFLADTVGPVNLVMDLHITHERWGSSSNPVLNGKLHHPLPADIEKPVPVRLGHRPDH